MSTAILDEPEALTDTALRMSDSPPLFADIVFDRPLDHAYSYAVPENLRHLVGVGKRVEAPFGRGDKRTPGFCVRVSEQTPTYENVKAITRVLDADALVDEHLMKLTRWMADYYLCGWGQSLHKIVPAGVRENAGTRRASFVEAVPSDRLPNPVPTVTAKQKTVLERVRREGKPIEQTTLARALKCGTGPISGLVAKGLLRKFSERIESASGWGIRGLEGEAPVELHAPIAMNADQLRVWEPIQAAVREGGFHPFLLHGVTGSGKTELYLRAIEDVVKQGKEAIVLVPEISLTPQTIERFRGRCGEVAVMHSHLTDAERGAYWRRIAGGSVQVVVGARSAVFAPTRKLGLIVVDEEHENSFKQESTPRYHGRDVAVMRARLESIPIILGSATPSLESWSNAQKGHYKLLHLPNRVEDRPMPPVKIVDLRHEPKPERGKPGAISPTLEAAMKEALRKGGQAILLLNRRGFSTHVHCQECGHVAQCAHCDLALTFHRMRSALVCHYCGFESAPFARCPACNQDGMRYQGLGTEKLHAEIEAKFPGKVCQRMDSDTMTSPGSHQRVLDAFRDGNIHILVGTQMIAKGLDFPNVTLVGVVNADVGLHLPDFRAAERTFQLLAQVAGRAGRGSKGGQVLVQTYTPEHPCIMLAAKHDFETFASQELLLRQAHQYPPFQRMARLIVRSEKEESANEFAETMAGAFREAMKQGGHLRLLGPAECPVFRLNDYYRFHFQLQSESSAVLHNVLREVITVVKPPSGVEFQVDVDPYSML